MANIAPYIFTHNLNGWLTKEKTPVRKSEGLLKIKSCIQNMTLVGFFCCLLALKRNYHLHNPFIECIGQMLLMQRFTEWMDEWSWVFFIINVQKWFQGQLPYLSSFPSAF